MLARNLVKKQIAQSRMQTIYLISSSITRQYQTAYKIVYLCVYNWSNQSHSASIRLRHQSSARTGDQYIIFYLMLKEFKIRYITFNAKF